jgi:hypothetical protein
MSFTLFPLDGCYLIEPWDLPTYWICSSLACIRTILIDTFCSLAVSSWWLLPDRALRPTYLLDL